jgi:hypothetical protein
MKILNEVAGTSFESNRMKAFVKSPLTMVGPSVWKKQTGHDRPYEFTQLLLFVLLRASLDKVIMAHGCCLLARGMQ